MANGYHFNEGNDQGNGKRCHGPSAKPAITMATSLGSKERKPAKRIGITLPKFVSTYAKAQKTPIDVKFLVLLFILTSNKKSVLSGWDGEKRAKKPFIIFSHSDLCQMTNTAGLGITPSLRHALADFTADKESHLAPKILYF